MGEHITIHFAKTQLSALIARAEAGEEIVISRGATPVAKLVPLVPPTPRRPGFGHLRGLVSIGEEALDDWTEAEMGGWEEGRPGDPLR